MIIFNENIEVNIYKFYKELHFRINIGCFQIKNMDKV
jgi:hypothetical protein